MSTVDRRQRIITAARQLFVEQSYEKVTTSEVARRAGVAYGLIAHHFENKRGLYLAVMAEITGELAGFQDDPRGDTPDEQLRDALTRHVAYIDKHAKGFAALMRGGLGSDPELRAMIDQLRWNGAMRILRRLGVDEPVPPVLRSTMRGWVGYFDEIMLDRLEQRDLDATVLVELAAANLITALRTAIRIDPPTGIDPNVMAVLEAAHDSASQ
jgi:AcrR family transcriptional regulator